MSSGALCPQGTGTGGPVSSGAWCPRGNGWGGPVSSGALCPQGPCVLGGRGRCVLGGRGRCVLGGQHAAGGATQGRCCQEAVRRISVYLRLSSALGSPEERQPSLVGSEPELARLDCFRLSDNRRGVRLSVVLFCLSVSLSLSFSLSLSVSHCIFLPFPSQNTMIVFQ